MSSRADHLAALTGLRAVAAAWVIAFHVTPLAEGLVPVTRVLAPLADVGWLGVDVFFVLSGFVLAHVHGADFAEHLPVRAWGRFLWLRLARVYPGHAAVTIALVAVVVAAGAAGVDVPHQGTAGDLVQHLLLVHGWGLASSLTWNGPSWSVSAEWAAYLVFPLLVRGVLVHVRGRAAAAALAAAALGAVLAAYGVLGDDQRHLTTTAPLWRILGEFTAGAALHAVVRPGDGPGEARGEQPGARRAPAPGLADLLVVAVPTLAVVLGRDGGPVLVVVPLLAGAVAALAVDTSVVGRLLSSRPLQVGGRGSYAAYLVHEPVLLAAGLAASHLRPPPVMGAALLAAALASLLIAAAALHLLVEEPARRALRSAGGGRQRPRPPRPIGGRRWCSRSPGSM